jgi:AraC-like DNA-binding protein
MNNRKETDVIEMLKYTVVSLKSFARIHGVKLGFRSRYKEILLYYSPEEILHVVIKLICRSITYTTPGRNISLDVSMAEIAGRKILKICLRVTGINLFWISQITQDIRQNIIVQSTPDGGTTYLLEWPFLKTLVSELDRNEISGQNHQHLPSFYSEIRKHLQSHFTKADKLLATLASQNPKDAVFLEKVNFLILTNIDKDGFNSNRLSKAMGMSRTQLYRKLHPIIRQAPGVYIQTMRIQKAKELLETTDMRIGEVAFNTGFQTPSHFTRIFSKHYGVKPSAFFRKSKM